MILQEEISRMKSIMGIQEQNQVAPINLMKLVPSTPNQAMIDSNKKILSQITDTEIKNSLPVPEDKLFLFKLLNKLSEKGVTPFLNVNTNDLGQNQSVSGGVSISIPKTNLNLNLMNGYFGVDIPIKDSILSLGYQSGIPSGGYKSAATTNNFTPNSKFGFNVQIPIGRK
jgi:hypothetical protein